MSGVAPEVVCMLAATHVPVSIGVPIALAALGILGWYWQRLGASEVPDARRRLRRAATVSMALAVPLVFVAACIIDPQIRPQSYVLAWTMVALLTLGMVGFAVVDVMLSAVIFQREAADLVSNHRATLEAALHERRAELEAASAASAGADAEEGDARDAAPHEPDDHQPPRDDLGTSSP